MKKIILVLGVLILSALFMDLLAQCPMCKMAADSNLKNGGTAGQGLNTGILYMLAMPYLFISFLSFIWIKNRRKSDDEVIVFDV